MKQTRNYLVVADYHGLSVSFTDDGWFNATQVALRFGKSPYEWLRLASTVEYLDALKEQVRTGEIPFLKVKRGGRGKSDSTWMHPKLGVPFARWLDARFAVWCDAQIDAVLRGGASQQDWDGARLEAATTYSVVSEILALTRASEGKTTESHHFANEARLIGFALTGEFQSVERDSLSAADLRLLKRLEVRDTALIAIGKSYAERKTALVGYATTLRTGRSGRRLGSAS